MAHYGSGDGSPTHVDKADGSPLTAADRAAHESIVADLTAWRPDIPIISEEADLAPYEVREAWPRFWLVDPLDGTKEFLQRNGEFTVNIALIEDGVPVLGIVFAPALDLLYAAATGVGAWRQSGNAAPEPIFHAQPVDGAGLIVVESRSHPSPELETFLDGLE